MSFVCQFDASFMEWISYENETFFYTFPSHYYEDNWTIRRFMRWNSDWTEWLGVIYFKETKSKLFIFFKGNMYDMQALKIMFWNWYEKTRLLSAHN